MHLKLGDFFEPKAEKFLDQNAYESFTATVSEDEQKTYDLNTEAMAKGEHLLHQSSLQWIHMFEANYADMVFRRFASETEKQIFENREKRIELYWFDITPTLRERCLQYGNSKNIKKTMKPDQKQQISLFILKLKFYSQLSQFEQTLLLDFFLPNLKSGFKERTTGAGEFFPHHFVVAKNILQPALIIGHLSPNNHQGFQDALLALDGFPITFATIASIREFELRF